MQKHPSTLARILPAILTTYLVVWTIAVTYLGGWLVIALNTEYQYGYINRTGQFVIKPYYDSAGEFKDDKAEVGILDSEGERVYYYVMDKKGDWIASNGDGSTMNWNWDPFYFRGVHFSEDDQLKDSDLVRASQDFEFWGLKVTKMGFRPNKRDRRGFYTGDWVIPPKFDTVTPFRNGVAWVYIKTSDNKEDHWGKGRWGSGLQGHWGMIDKKGNYVIKPQCISHGNFREGLAPCMVRVYFDTFYITPYGVSLAHRLKPPLAIRFLIDIATH